MNKETCKKRVKEVMSTDVVAVHPQDTLHEALVLTVENRVSALPVTDVRERCIGMISTTDLIDLTCEMDEDMIDLGRVTETSRQWLLDKLTNGIGSQQVSSVMSNSIASIGPENSLVEASQEMLRHRVHRLPVVDDHQRLLGIISTMDILGAFAEDNSH